MPTKPTKRGRTIVVGDVHGCRDEAERLLELVNFGVGDALYFLGLIHYRKGESAKACDYFTRYKATPDFALLSPDERGRIDDILAQCKK